MPRCLPLLALLACAPSSDAGAPTATGDSSDVSTSLSASSAEGPATGGPSTGDDSDPSASDAADDASAGSDTADDAATTESTTGDQGETASTAPAESTGADGGASAQCDDLMACCEQLGADIYAGCATVVDLDMPELCESTLATYHQEGYCTGEPYCDDLGACCSELPPGPGWEETCTYYADLGNQPQCAMLISDYQLSGYCE